MSVFFLFDFSHSALHILSETGSKAIAEWGAQVESRRGSPSGLEAGQGWGTARDGCLPTVVCSRSRESSHMGGDSEVRLCS